jgi:hypothetical protein
MRFRRSVCCAATILGLFASGVMLSADGPLTLPFRSLLTSDAGIQLAIASCYRDSPTCHRLLDEIESSSTVVYLSRGQCQPGRGGSCLRFSAASPDARYLHIVLDKDLSGDYLLKLAAHEFQHVVEVVRAPQVVDRSSFRSLYQRIGFLIHGSGMREEWETDEAQRIALVVSKEASRSQRQALLASR